MAQRSVASPAEVDAVARERMYHLTAPASPAEPAPGDSLEDVLDELELLQPEDGFDELLDPLVNAFGPCEYRNRAHRRQSRSDIRRTQAFGRWRSRVRLKRQQVGDGGVGMRQV